MKFLLSRSLCWRSRRRCIAWLFTFVVAISITLAGFVHYMAYILHKYSCTNHESVLYLEELCRNYTSGMINGSLCSPLCDTKEIQFLKCLGHGVKLHVFKAQWNGHIVILKAKNSLGSKNAVQHAESSVLPWMTREEYQMTKEVFIQRANVSLFYNLAGETYSSRTIEVLEEIFAECDLKGDGLLNYEEMITCWELVETNEYVLYLILRGKSAALEIYGVCGNMYAVQYAAAEPYLGFQSSWTDERTWNFRVKLALALLGMIESIDETPYGTLYLCDIQEANFGVVKKSDGSLVAKAIDVDICFFPTSMLKTAVGMRNTSCTRNKDCLYFSCSVTCDTSIGKCSGDVVSNNLNQLCGLVFLEKFHLHPALLQNPPESITKQLSDVLYRCSRPGTMHMDKKILQELRTLLSNSIQMQ